MISPLVNCGARMSIAGRMSRTGPALRMKGGPGPWTTPGPLTGITSSPFHTPFTAHWPLAWHCALADWRAQTGAAGSGTGSSGGGSAGSGRQQCTPLPPSHHPSNQQQPPAHNSPSIPAPPLTLPPSRARP